MSTYIYFSDVVCCIFGCFVVGELICICARWKCLGESLVEIYKNISSAVVSQSCPFTIVSVPLSVCCYECAIVHMLLWVCRCSLAVLHASNLRASSFYWLRQLRRVLRSLDAESAATLVHAFVMLRVDYCNGMLAGAPKSITDKLRRVLNAVARIVTGISKYDLDVSHLLYAELHWLDVLRWVWYRLCTTVHRCLHDKTPQCLVDCCTSVSDQPVATSCLCHNTDVWCSAVGPSLLLSVSLELAARQSTRPGTLCRLFSAWCQDFSIPRLLAYIARW